MVESQIVILVVAGSNPVGHPSAVFVGHLHAQIAPFRNVGTPDAKQASVINPTLHSTSSENTTVAFWQRILNDGALAHCDALEKLVAGCEIIAAVDDLDLLAA